jgi:hypothetical protein
MTMGDNPMPTPTIAEVQSKARTQMLDALSADHRQFLGHLIGQLVGAKPSEIGLAIEELENILTSGEKHSIDCIAADLEEQKQKIWAAFHEWQERDARKSFGKGVQGDTAKVSYGKLDSPSIIMLDLLIHDCNARLNRVKYGSSER